MWQLCTGQDYKGVFDRGAEDCQEGAERQQGEAIEEICNGKDVLDS